MTEPLLEARDLVLGYGAAPVLRVPRLSIAGGRGTVTGLAGVNGAGKSAFLKACLGLLAPIEGSLRLLGERPGTRAFRGVLARVGYVPQARPAGTVALTVRELVECGRYGRVGFLGRWRAADGRAVETAMEEAGVVRLAGKAVQELSGGQYQRAQIARALAAEPELLILDEPGSHLDAEGRSGVAALIGRLAGERRASLLLVSHDEELLALADSRIEFADGSLECPCMSTSPPCLST